MKDALAGRLHRRLPGPRQRLAQPVQRRTPNPRTQDGLGLNPVAGQDDVRAPVLRRVATCAVGPPGAQRGRRPAATSATRAATRSPGMAQATLDVAVQRVDNFAAGFLAAGATAVIADGHLEPRLRTCARSSPGAGPSRGSGAPRRTSTTTSSPSPASEPRAPARPGPDERRQRLLPLPRRSRPAPAGPVPAGRGPRTASQSLPGPTRRLRPGRSSSSCRRPSPPDAFALGALPGPPRARGQRPRGHGGRLRPPCRGAAGSHAGARVPYLGARSIPSTSSAAPAEGAPDAASGLVAGGRGARRGRRGGDPRRRRDGAGAAAAGPRQVSPRGDPARRRCGRSALRRAGVDPAGHRPRRAALGSPGSTRRPSSRSPPGRPPRCGSSS